MRSTFHHGTMKSHRLKMVLQFLTGCYAGATTMDIMDHCCTTRPSSDISELRANGVKIESKRIGKSENGGQIWSYKLIK